MEAFFQLLLLVIGLTLLWKMGELAVRNAIGFSALYGIHQFTIGFLIFAASTVLPEISSAIVSALNQVPELSVGDLVGSSLVNMSLILGIVAISAKKIEISSQLKKKLTQSVIMMSIAYLSCLIAKSGSPWKGGFFIALYLISVFLFQVGIPKEEVSEEIKEIEKEVEKIEKRAWISPKMDILIKLFGSLALLLAASWITVHAAVKLSDMIHLNLSLLGGTLIAVGTSFPELVLGIHAVRKKEYALILGDIFGSSFLNISFVLGLLMLMSKKVSLGFTWTVLPFIIPVFIWVLYGLWRKKRITRRDGLFFLSIFVIYLGWNAYSHFSVV